MTMPIVFLFSGQGSQHYQMGRALYDVEPSFRRAMLRFDSVVADLTGYSLLAQLYGPNPPTVLFDELILTHPAIVMVECALAEMLIEESIVPTAVLGCSLGSFAAAVASGCISGEQAVTLAVQQAEAVQAHCEAGAMLAIMAQRTTHEGPLAALGATLAADNFDTHFIISVRIPDLAQVRRYLQAHNLASQILPVRCAFHAPWLDSARAAFLNQMQPWSERVMCRPLWSCASAAPLKSIPPHYFWDVVQKPIQFAQTIKKLEQQGPCRYLDLGPSGTLATFLKYLLPTGSRSQAMAAMTRSGRDIQCLSTLRAACAVR